MLDGAAVLVRDLDRDVEGEVDGARDEVPGANDARGAGGSIVCAVRVEYRARSRSSHVLSRRAGRGVGEVRGGAPLLVASGARMCLGISSCSFDSSGLAHERDTALAHTGKVYRSGHCGFPTSSFPSPSYLLVGRTSRSSSSATDRRTPRTAARRTAPPALRAHDGRTATCGSDAAALEARCADAALEPAGTRAASQSPASLRRRVMSALACASGLDGREERNWNAHGSLREHVGHDVEPHRRAADVDLHV